MGAGRGGVTSSETDMGPSFLAAGKLAESGVDYFYQGGRPTIGTGGSILFSNTTALVDASLVVTNSGAMTVADSTVTISTNCTLAEGTTINWSSNTVGSVVNVGGGAVPASQRNVYGERFHWEKRHMDVVHRNWRHYRFAGRVDGEPGIASGGNRWHNPYPGAHASAGNSDKRPLRKRRRARNMMRVKCTV